MGDVEVVDVVGAVYGVGVADGVDVVDGAYVVEVVAEKQITESCKTTVHIPGVGRCKTRLRTKSATKSATHAGCNPRPIRDLPVGSRMKSADPRRYNPRPNPRPELGRGFGRGSSSSYLLQSAVAVAVAVDVVAKIASGKSASGRQFVVVLGCVEGGLQKIHGV